MNHSRVIRELLALPSMLALGGASFGHARPAPRGAVRQGGVDGVTTASMGQEAPERTSRLQAVARYLRANLQLIVLTAMMAIFGIWYGRPMIGMPPFGDAATHARISRSMLEHGPWGTTSDYPPLYHGIGAVALWMGGEQAFVFITLASVLALGVAVYFFAFEATASRWVATTAALIAFASPKAAYYAGRLYMEIPLAALVVVSMTFMHRYLRLRKRRDVLLAASFIGLSCLLKQQGLLLLGSAALFLIAEAGWRRLRGQEGARRAFRYALMFCGLAGVLVIPAVLWMLHSTGRVFPDSDYTETPNRIAARIVGYQEPAASQRAESWDAYLETRFVSSGEATRGFSRAEGRHIWPQDVLTPSGFLKANSPYMRGGRLFGATWNLLFGVLLAGGTLAWMWRPRSRAFVVFFPLFLATNYVTFFRNNDQQRYHLYLAFLFAFTIPFVVDVGLRRFGRLALTIGALALIGAIVVYGRSYFPSQMRANGRYDTTQAYTPSVGGIASVKEASNYLNAHMNEDERYFAVPPTEFDYYSDRTGMIDYRIYFLDPTLIARFFDEQHIRFIVIPASTVRPDSQWTHVLWTPSSFNRKIAAMYPLAFRTSKGDISVYGVKPSTSLGPLPELDVTAPVTAFETPVKDGDVVSGPVSIRATATDNDEVAEFRFYIDGKYKKGVRGPLFWYSWSWDTTTVKNGRHRISIEALDTSQNPNVRDIYVQVAN